MANYFFLRIFVSFFCFHILAIFGHQTPCNVNNATKCLKGVLDLIQDPDAWWFGNSFDAECPENEPVTHLKCLNPNRSYKTIISRVMSSNTYNLENLDQVLKIRFYTPKGHFISCGKLYTADRLLMGKEIDSTHSIKYSQWSMSHRPAITWEPEDGVVYSLLAYDAGSMMLSGLWININGGDYSLGQELVPYQGIFNALPRNTPLAFVLLKQTTVINPSFMDTASNYLKMLKAAETYDNIGEILATLSSFVNTDPVGFGLIYVKADPFGINQFYSKINNCPYLAASTATDENVKAVFTKTRFTDMTTLQIDLEIVYHTHHHEDNMTVCCQAMEMKTMRKRVTPVEASYAYPYVTQHKPFVHMSAVNKMEMNPLQGKLFTLLMLDVTNFKDSNHAPLYWFIIDNHGSSFSDGMVLAEYHPPLPHANENKVFMFLVLDQTDGTMAADYDHSKYCHNKNAVGPDCHFDVEKFTTEYKLKLAGINWFKSKPDLWSRYKHYEDKASKMDSACEGVDGYSSPCPVPCLAPRTDPPRTNEPTRRSMPPPGNPDSGDSLTPKCVVLMCSVLISVLISLI